jgi:hypothetical protein
MSRFKSITLYILHHALRDKDEGSQGWSHAFSFRPRLAYLERCSWKILIGRTLSRGNAESGQMGLVGLDAAVATVA